MADMADPDQRQPAFAGSRDTELHAASPIG